jgi:hypothetical protein
VPNRSGGLTGATFVYRLQKITTNIAVTDLQQIWLTGVGTVSDDSIMVETLYVNSGGTFGDDFDPNEILNNDWGSLLIDFNGCHTAAMSYSSKLEFNAEAFGSGGYPISRIAMNPPARVCEETGFDNIENNHWMAGSFYGGVDRNGEGFIIDLLEDDRAVVTWYTYLPTEPCL